MVKSIHLADVAELADALVSGTSGSNLVEVQVLSSAPKSITYKWADSRNALVLL